MGPIPRNHARHRMDVSPYVEGHHDTAAALTPVEHAGMEEAKSDDLRLRMPAPQAVAHDVVAAVPAAPDEHEALACSSCMDSRFRISSGWERTNNVTPKLPNSQLICRITADGEI